MDRSTIAAIATPAGTGGVGIIKISGPEAIRTTADIFSPGPPGNCPPDRFDPEWSSNSWRFHYGRIVDPDSGRMVDEVLLAIMRAPRSYTCEDVVEIQAHAGTAVLKAIMDLLTARGIRLAEPGEFTRRAFLNGRIDLTQAEAVIDMINARSDAAREMAASQMAGALGSEITRIRAVLSDSLAEVEALIDFPEAVDDEIDSARLSAGLSSAICRPIAELIARHDAEDVLRSGHRVVIAGGPNVGKSSLMNRLVGSERTIVSDLPGTTRDFIEATFFARGIPVILADTAGLRSDPEPLEKLGIEKTREYIEAADIILYVMDAGSPVSAEDLEMIDAIAGKRAILVINKIDLPREIRRCRIPGRWEGIRRVEISALYQTGLDLLTGAIADLAGNFSSGHSDRLVPNMRHRSLLDRAFQSVNGAIKGLEEGLSAEFISIDLRSAHDALCEITGEKIAPDLLDRIFDRYCIGK